MELFLNLLFLAIGMVFLIKGADFFVDGASKIARALKIPSLIVGLTLVSIGTSLPELSVSITSAIKGMTDMSFGNVIGSNIFNTFVVIGISALFIPLVVSKNMLKYDIPILLFIYLLVAIFGYVITPNVIDLYESISLFILMIAYVAFLVIRSKKEIQMEENGYSCGKWYKNILFVVIGLIGIVLGGSAVVGSSKYIAISLGMSELLVGLTIVAVGTSLPELVTSIVAARRGENDIAIGNAIGSCIFNIILILALSGIITPTSLIPSSIIDVIFMIVSAALILIMSLGGKKIGRGKGIILVLIYAIYLTYIILRNLSIF